MASFHQNGGIRCNPFVNRVLCPYLNVDGYQKNTHFGLHIRNGLDFSTMALTLRRSNACSNSRSLGRPFQFSAFSPATCQETQREHEDLNHGQQTFTQLRLRSLGSPCRGT